MKYLITGGTGFLGQELIKRLYGKAELVVVARNEGNLVALKEKYPDITIIPGDIADPFVADKACKGVDGIYHLAAMKHVGLAEENVHECISSNVQGTINLLEATRKYKPEFIIGISTDKAARVKGIYGASKLIQEGLFREYESLNPTTEYRTVRYGNVLYSTGSVLCKWKEKMQRGEEVILTDPNATRFYWTVSQAVDLIFDCLKNATDSTPQGAKMKAMRMDDLANAMFKKYGNYSEGALIWKTIGLQPGENLHETIDGITDSSEVERYTMEEIMEII